MLNKIESNDPLLKDLTTLDHRDAEEGGLSQTRRGLTNHAKKMMLKFAIIFSTVVFVLLMIATLAVFFVNKEPHERASSNNDLDDWSENFEEEWNQNSTNCADCPPLDVPPFGSVEEMELIWTKPNSLRAYQHTISVIMNTPSLRKLKTNVRLTMEDLQRLAKTGVNLEKAELVLSLNGSVQNSSNSTSVEFSLSHLNGFTKLSKLTLNLTLNEMDRMDKKVIFVTDFSQLRRKSVIKDLTIFSNFHELRMTPGVHRFCLKKCNWHKSQPYSFNCVG